MNNDLQKRIVEALRDPQNMGELPNADAVGTVGNSECGEMLRMWIKYKEDRGKKVIDKATFQSFGCETAIAVASLATELIKGKTAEEALSLKTNELAGPKTRVSSNDDTALISALFWIVSESDPSGPGIAQRCP